MLTIAYVFISVLLALAVAAWLRAELHITSRSLRAGWLWLAAAPVAELVAGGLAAAYNPMEAGNILLHAVGGGVVSALLFFYLAYTFRVRISWRVQLVLLFCFTSALGVLNELAEYTLELLHMGTFSYDPHDTWRDLVSNTSGALAAWLVVRTAAHFARRKGHRPDAPGVQ